MKRLACLPAVLTLVACVTTLSEVPGTFTDRGRTYPTITREFERPDGSTYARMTIIVGNERVSCIPEDVRDCRLALATRPVRERD